MSENDASVPRHLGLILDGNRRWARARGKTVLEGHRAGYENLKTVLRAAFREGVEYVSAYVFSTENWQRETAEVQGIMQLLKWVLKHEVAELQKEGIRLRFAGSRERVSAALSRAMTAAEEQTAAGAQGTLIICLDYGSRQEITDAVRKLVHAGTPVEAVTPELISANLYVPEAPPLDLVIRPSGEQRLSNFMLWQAAYAELLFTDVLWPDFSEQELQAAFAAYRARQRRFGT